MMKKLFLKPNPPSLNNNTNNQINIDKLTQKSNEKEPKLNNSFVESKNNITVDYPKNYSFLKSPIELPKISGIKKNYGLNKAKLSGIKHIILSNSSKNIYSQNMMGIQNNNSNKFLRRDKTHSMLIKEEDSDNDITNDNINLNNISLNNIYKNNGEIALLRRKIKNNSNKNINNITNINIHIHSNENQINNNIIYRNSNTQSLAKKKQNITSRDLANKHDTLTSNKNIFNSDNKTIETLSNINPNKNNILNNSNIINNNNNNLLLQRNNNIKIRILKKKSFQKSQRTGGGHSPSVEGNGKTSSLSIVGNIIINNNKMNSINRNNRSNSKETNNNIYNNNKIPKNSLPEISLTQIEGINKKLIEEKYNLVSSNKGKNKTLIEVLEEYEEIDIIDIEKINDTSEFLENLCEKKMEDFGTILKIIQTHLDIEILLNSLNIKKTGNKNSKLNNSNNTLKQKMQLCMTNEKQYKLFNLLINYFNFLSDIYTNNYILRIKYLQKEHQNDLCFFLFQVLNNLFKNIIKSQICLYSSVFISLSHLAIFDFNLVVKNYFFKIFKEISYSLYNIFEFFIKNELQKNYNNLIETNLRPDFFDNYEKVFKEHKITETKNREIIKIIVNNITKSINSFINSKGRRYSTKSNLSTFSKNTKKTGKRKSKSSSKICEIDYSKSGIDTSKYNQIKKQLYCSFCANPILKSALKFSCNHYLCSNCISRQILKKGLEECQSKTVEGLIIIDCPCNSGNTEIIIDELLSILYIDEDCLNHGELKTCQKCSLWTSVLNQIKLCEIHRNRFENKNNFETVIKDYCLDCQKELCNLCIKESHDGHNIKSLENIIKEIQRYKRKNSNFLE